MAGEINQKLGFDASSAIASLRDLQNVLNGANTALSNFAGTAKTFEKNARPITAVLDRWAKSATEVGKVLRSLGLNIDSVNAATGRLGQNQGFAAAVARFKDMAAQIEKTKEAQAKLANQPVPQNINWAVKGAAAMNVLRGAISRVASALKTLVFAQVFQSFTQLTSQAVEEARKFGLAIAEIQTIGGALNQTNVELTQNIIALSNELGKSAQDVAEGLYQTISNQVVEASDAFRLLAEAQKLAITTHSSTAEAVDALSSVMNSYSLGIERANEVSGILFETVNLGRVRLNEIADRIGRVTPQAAQMGVAFTEVGAAIATMTVQGVKADTAITQLRAIMSKLLKPTEELKKVFRSWGVEDGPAALKAFGGLAGVLRKLSQETNGSASEMSEFFNVVRAMTGVLSLNTNEGKKFADTLAKMEDAGNAASNAYQKFLASDAQSFTVQINQVKNAILQLGIVAIPVIVSIGNFFQKVFAGLGPGIERLFYNHTQKLAATLKRTFDKMDKEFQAREKAFTKFEEKEWKQREQLTREAIANMGADFDKFIVKFETGQKVANAIFKGFADSISDAYKDAYSDLDDYISKAEDRIKDGQDFVTDLQQKWSDLAFDISLDKARGAFGKLDMLTRKSAGEMNQAINQSFNEIADPEVYKKVQEGFSQAFKTGEQAVAEARRIGDPRKISEAMERLRSVTIAADTAQKRFDATIKAGIPDAEKAKVQLTEKGQALDVLLAKYEDQQVAFQKAGTQAQKDQATRAMDELKKQIIATDFGPEADIMSKIGLDPSSLKKAQFLISEVFNLKDVEWKNAQESLQATLDKAKLSAKVDFVPSGKQLVGLGETAKKLGVNESDFQTPANFMVAAIDKAKKSISEKEALDRKAATAEHELEKAYLGSGKQLEDVNQTIADYVVQQKAAAQAQKETLFRKALFSFSPIENRGLATQLFEQNVKQVEANGKAVTDFTSNLQKMYEQVKAGTPLAADQNATLADMFVKFNNAEGVTEGLKESMNELFKYVTKASEALNTIGDVNTEKIDRAGEFDAASKIITQVEVMGMRMEVFKGQLDEVNGKVKYNTQTQEGQTEAVNNTTDAVNWLNEVTFNLSIPISSATSQMYNLADAAWAAADAVAAATSTNADPFAYSGGAANFLAAGGRGKDTIPAMLSKGEFVSSASTTKRFFSELNAMNNGSRPVYREQGGSVTNVGDVNVTVKGGDSSQQTVREIGHALRREIQRGNIKLK